MQEHCSRLLGEVVTGHAAAALSFGKGPIRALSSASSLTSVQTGSPGGAPCAVQPGPTSLHPAPSQGV